jgi:hypothetical protein
MPIEVKVEPMPRRLMVAPDPELPRTMFSCGIEAAIRSIVRRP